jgi:hypothetical protein
MLTGDFHQTIIRKPPLTDSLYNRIAIGYRARVAGSICLVIGGQNLEEVKAEIDVNTPTFSILGQLYKSYHRPHLGGCFP